MGGLFQGDGTVIGYRDDGSPIRVSNPRDLGDFISGAIQTAPAEISFNVGSEQGGGIPPGTVIDGSVVNQPGLFDRIFGTLKDVAVSAINFLGPVALAATPVLIESFNQKQITDGLSQTLNDNVTTVFDRPTIENIFNTQGGIDSILAQGSTPITLPDGTSARGYEFSNTTTIIFDENGNFLGQFKNGRYELGEFSVTGNREFVLKDGVILEDLGDGNTLRIEVKDSKITHVTIEDASNSPIVHIEGKDEPIFIKGPDEEVTLGNNVRVEFGPIALGFELGKLAKVSVSPGKAVPSMPQSGTGDTLYALTNGILNTELFSAPGYLLNLMQDIITQSAGKVGLDDIILAPTFFSSGLLAVWNALGTIKTLLSPTLGGFIFDVIFEKILTPAINLIKDSALWLAETFDSTTLGQASLNVLNALENHFRFNEEDRARELVGVGYSGGFLTLGEVLATNVYNADLNTGYNAVSLVGLGGANIQLDGVFRDVLDKMIGVGETLMKGTTKTLDFLQSLRGGLDALALLSSGPAGAVSLTQAEADQVYNAVRDISIEAGYDAFVAIVQQKTWSAFAPSLTGTSEIGVVVNVFGTQDILTKLSVGGETIGGYRDSIGAYSVGDEFRTLVNVEIVGASHFDYIRPEEKNQWWESGVFGIGATVANQLFGDENRQWNQTVSTFAADLINNAQDADTLRSFLERQRLLGFAQEEGGKWVIRLPGSEDRE